ncbi:MAG: NAD-dependent epimerase/dehydratase family protein [Spirochaetales bacterium]|nr:NAD-dependent epimerase/dehydratase family protein [Spirochaetales bacterium]
MKRVMVTGANGFLGTWLCRTLKEAGHITQGVDRTDRSSPWLDEVHVNNLSDAEAVDSLIQDCAPDVIFHLAGISFPPTAREKPAFVLQTNTVYTVQILEILRSRGWKGHFVFASSSDVYGAPDPADLPLTEEAPLRAITPYAATKIAAENFIRFFQNDLNITVVRPFNNIGPGQARQFVLPAFLGRIALAVKEQQKEIEVGDLSAVRDFIDVRDLARALLCIMEYPGELPFVLNVCRGVPVTIAELLELCCSVATVQLSFRVDPALLRPEGPDRRYGSPRRLQSLGWHPVYSLEQTIRDCWQEQTRS